MSRFAPYVEAIAVVVVGIVAVFLANEYAIVPEASPSLSATSTVSTIPSSYSPTVTLTEALPEAIEAVAASSTVAISPRDTVTTTSPKVTKAPSPVPSKAPAQPAVTAPTPVPAPLPSSGNVSLDASAAALRAALVNILCYAPAGSRINSILGTGVFIDSKGIILTNAHVAQYFLLADRGVSCTIRTGSPATDTYKAALIYISPAWIHANSAVLTQAQPIGTGEYDFALLAVTKSATSAPLPTAFPYVPLAKQPPAIGTPVVIASYGAQFLEAAQIRTSLSPIVVFGSVKDVFTFGTNTVDDLDLGGSAAAQEGSSGGGVTDASGTLVGTITTSTVEGSTATRSLSAITESYVRAEYAREMNSTLDELLSAPTADSIAEFAPEIQILEPILTANL